MEKNVHGAGFCTVVLSVRTYTLSPSFSLSRRWHWHTQERRALSLVCSASRPVVGFLSCRSAAAILSFSFSLLLYHCTHTHTHRYTQSIVYTHAGFFRASREIRLYGQTRLSGRESQRRRRRSPRTVKSKYQCLTFHGTTRGRMLLALLATYTLYTVSPSRSLAAPEPRAVRRATPRQGRRARGRERQIEREEEERE